MRLTVSTRPIGHPGIACPTRLAIVADLHGRDGSAVAERLRKMKIDGILVAGDLADDLIGDRNGARVAEGGNERRVLARDAGFRFLKEAASIAPTFYTPGNHELNCCGHFHRRTRPTGKCLSRDMAEAVRASGAILLENGWTEFRGIRIGGLLPGLRNGEPDTGWLRGFCDTEAFRLLICHVPEYYPKYLRALPIDLCVAGHAHGGQWRLFGRGVYAPGQGLFPKYTKGLYEGRLLVSAGVGDHTRVPRLFNPHEIPVVELGGNG